MSDKLSNNAFFARALTEITNSEMQAYDVCYFVIGGTLFAKYKDSSGTPFTVKVSPTVTTDTISFTPSGNQTFGASPPTVQPAGTLPVWNFSYVSPNDINLSCVLPPDYFPNTAMQLRVNWATTQTGGPNIEWTVGYGHLRVNQLLTGDNDATISQSVTVPIVQDTTSQALFVIAGDTYQYLPGDTFYFDLELSITPLVDFTAVPSIILTYERAF